MNTNGLRVVHIIDHMGLGGVQTFLRSILPALKPHGIVPYVINLRGTTELTEALIQHGIPVFSLNRKRWDIRQITDIISILRTLKPAVAHTHLTAGKMIGRLAAIKTGIPYIILDDQLSISQDVYSVPVPIILAYRLLEPVLARSTALYITPSQSVLEASQAAKRWPNGRCRVIPNAVDVQRFIPCSNRAAIRQKLGLADKITVTTLGRIVKQKRIDDVLHVAEQVIQSGYDVQFLIAGRGPLEEELDQQIKASGLTDRVLLLGYRRDTEDLLAASDIYLSASAGEALSLAVLEAMASGCVVVGTRAGGTAEQITNGETGFLVSVGDINAMVQAVEHLVADEQLRSVMSRAARADVIQRFSVAGVAYQLAQTYSALVEEKSYANL